MQKNFVKKIIKTGTVAIIAAFLVLIPLAARADMAVYSDGHEIAADGGVAIFSGVDNFAPGDSVSKTVVIKNSGESAIATAIKASASGDNDLAQYVNFSISQGTVSFFNGTLLSFYNATDGNDEWVPLSSVPARSGMVDGSAEYVLTIDFPRESTEGQKTSANFDLVFGAEEEGGAVADGHKTYAVISGGGSSGGDYIFKIYDNTVVGSSDCNGLVPVAAVEWNTNLAATSRVIYVEYDSKSGKNSDTDGKFKDPFNFAKSPDYGYYSTPEYDIATPLVNHKVVVRLESGKTYYYRAVSNQSTSGINGPFTAPDCGLVAGASTEKNGLEGVAGVSTGVLGEMTDEEIAQFMADLRAENQNSDNEQSGNKIAAATFVPAALAASNAPASASSQNSATANYGVIAAFAFLVMALVGRFLAKHLTR